MDDSYYNSIAAGYDSLHGTEQTEKLTHISSKLAPYLFSGCKLVDVGCGTGISTDFWTQFGCSCIGIDPSEGLLKQNTYGKSRFLQMGAEALDFADKSFDVVVSFTAAQNFTDVLLGIQEIKRVGKDVFCITTLKKADNVVSVEDAIKEVFGTYERIELDKDIAFLIIPKITN
jgi:ubiquinone/menaquinone biosynthesis C-methylase UbiE